MSSVKPSQCRGDESLCGRPSALPRHSETSLTEGKTTTKPSKNTTRHPHYKLRMNPSIFHQTYQTAVTPDPYKWVILYPSSPAQFVKSLLNYCSF